MMERRKKENKDLIRPIKRHDFRIQYPKLRNMTHALSLRVFIAFKGTNRFIFYLLLLQLVLCRVAALISP